MFACPVECGGYWDLGILVIPKYPGVKGEAITFPCLVYTL